jgi:uncharacterized protein YjbI with pentapeptide repeats
MAAKLTGALLNRSLLQDVRFVECRADYAEWQGITAQRVDFIGCNLDHAYFNDADLTGVRFRDCDLRHADFTNAQLAGADFRGSNLEEIVIAVDQLRGVKVTTDQAIYLCGLIGLDIDDEVGLLD